MASRVGAVLRWKREQPIDAGAARRRLPRTSNRRPPKRTLRTRRMCRTRRNSQHRYSLLAGRATSAALTRPSRRWPTTPSHRRPSPALPPRPGTRGLWTRQLLHLTSQALTTTAAVTSGLDQPREHHCVWCPRRDLLQDRRGHRTMMRSGHRAESSRRLVSRSPSLDKFPARAGACVARGVLS